MVSSRRYGRYWGVILAFGWLILCGAQPPKEQPKSANSGQPAVAAPSPPFAAYAGYNPDPCYQSKDHDAADLCAQWRAAIAAEKAAYEAGRAVDWSIVATLLSAAAIGGLFITICQGRVANRIASDTAKRQLRAYLVAPIVKIENGRRWRICAIIKNVGQTPAKAISVTTDFMAGVINAEPGAAPFGPLGPGEERLHARSVQTHFTPDFPQKGEPCLRITLEYSDVFGRAWQASYVYFLHGSGQRRDDEDWHFHLHPDTREEQ